MRVSTPTVDPRFATDSVYQSDGDDWGGDPTKATPSAGRIAEGFEPDSLPAEWLNYVLNLLGEWAYYIAIRLGGLSGSGEWTYESAKTRHFYACGARLSSGIGNHWVADGTVYASTDTAGAFGTLELHDLRSDQSFVTCTVKVIARAASMAVKLYQYNFTTSTLTQLGSTYNPTGSGAVETGTITVGPVTVDRTNCGYFLQIVSSASAGAGASQEYLYGATCAVTSPGPYAG